MCLLEVLKTVWHLTKSRALSNNSPLLFSFSAVTVCVLTAKAMVGKTAGVTGSRRHWLQAALVNALLFRGHTVGDRHVGSTKAVLDEAAEMIHFVKSRHLNTDGLTYIDEEMGIIHKTCGYILSTTAGSGPAPEPLLKYQVFSHDTILT